MYQLKVSFIINSWLTSQQQIWNIFWRSGCNSSDSFSSNIINYSNNSSFIISKSFCRSGNSLMLDKHCLNICCMDKYLSLVYYILMLILLEPTVFLTRLSWSRNFCRSCNNKPSIP
uniref:Uncharacterized protein n=1 Tax=Rhizophora mucronata TaxID=61149 RepID=A0A2P2ME79_RHIMU